MNHKKAYTIILLFPAFMMIYLGICLAVNYNSQEIVHTDFVNETVIVPANGTAYKQIELPQSWLYYEQSLTISNGTIQIRYIDIEEFDTWTNTSSSLGWSTIPNTAYSSYSPNGQNNWVTDIFMQNGTYNKYLVLWNSNSPINKEVSIQIFQETFQHVPKYFNLGIGIALIVLGTIIGVAATLKLGKRVFITALSVLMIISGIFLTFAEIISYNWYQRWEILNFIGFISGVLLLPAGIVLIYLSNKAQLKQFNKALENQE